MRVVKKGVAEEMRENMKMAESRTMIKIKVKVVSALPKEACAVEERKRDFRLGSRKIRLKSVTVGKGSESIREDPESSVTITRILSLAVTRTITLARQRAAEYS